MYNSIDNYSKLTNYKKQFPLLQFSDNEKKKDIITVSKLSRPNLGVSPTERKKNKKLLNKIENYEDNLKKKTEKVIQDMYINFTENFDAYLSKNKRVDLLSKTVNENTIKLNNLEEKINKLLKHEEEKLFYLNEKINVKICELDGRIKYFNKLLDVIDNEENDYKLLSIR